MADDFGSTVGAGNLGAVAVGGSTLGELETQTDRDWFAVTLVAGTTYIIKQDGITLADPRFTLRDSNGVALAGNDDFNGLDAQITFTATVSGTYYIDANSADAGSPAGLGTYRVSVAVSAAPPPVDDYAAQAGSPSNGTVAIGGSTTGNLETAGDHDWFAVTLVAGTSYIFQQNSITLNDPRMTLRDANGIAITGNDDTNGLNAQINYTAAVSGTYYLDANSADGNAPLALGTYTVSAAIDGAPPPPPVDDFGAQVGAGNLGSVTVGSTATGTLEVGLDQDWFAVTLSAGSTYRFRQEANTLSDPRFQLLNSLGLSLAGDDDSGGGLNAQLDFTALTSGTYYINANSADSNGTGTYTVRATLLYGAPIIVSNTGSTATEGGSDTITAAELLTTDPDSAAGSLTYRVTSGITNGTLSRNGSALAVNDTFTQTDINNGLVVYTHNGSETTSASFGFSVTDGTTTFNSQTFTFAVTPVDDPAVALDDAFAGDEDDLVSGNVFADNGSGADSDMNSGFAVTEVNGNTASVGNQITLASGALLTLNANGSFSYNPNGAFAYLPVGDTADDTFTYTVNGGDTATVTVTLTGLDNDDLVIGTASDDTLDGGSGADRMRGLTGDDIYEVDNLFDVVEELPGGGTDRARVSINFVAHPERFAEVEVFELVGSATRLTGNRFGNTLIANAGADSVLIALGGNDVLVGAGGDDLLDGGGGDNSMNGGLGDDSYIVYDAGDTVTELENEGTDYIRSGVNWALGEHVENLRLAGAANEGTGNALANTLWGGREGATLLGLGGNDTIYGSNKADSIEGGEGIDTLFGNAGVDSIHGGAGDDIINGGTNGDFLYGDEGEDLVRGDAGNDALFGGIGNDQLEGGLNNDRLQGDAGADLMLGGDGVDVLIGGADRDIMTGGLGADDFVFDEGDFAGLTASTADRIVDFTVAEGDDIDLSGIDAIDGGTDDAFDYIGSTAFSGTAGEVRWAHEGGNTMVYLDIDGDALADFAIRLDGNLNLVATSFIL